MKRLLIITLCFCCALVAPAQKKTSTQRRTNKSATVRKTSSTQQKGKTLTRSSSTLTLKQVSNTFEKLPFAYCVEDQCGILNQLKGYEWVVKSPREKKMDMFPKRVEYFYYPSHPQYKLIGDKLYDEKGKLKAVLLLYTWQHASNGYYLKDEYDDIFSMSGSDERGGLVQDLAISAYQNNAYDAETQTNDSVKKQIEGILGLFKYTRPTIEDFYMDNMLSTNYEQAKTYCNQIYSDCTDKVWRILKVERVDSTSFNVHYATKEKKPTIVVKYTFFSDEPYKIRYERSFDDGMTSKEASKETLDEEGVDIMPSPSSFLSGTGSLGSYISNRFKYLADVQNKNITGTIIVQFTVLSNGRVTNAKIEQSLNEKFDNEVLRIINGMPRWYPGKKNKRLVNTIMHLPINFK